MPSNSSSITGKTTRRSMAALSIAIFLASCGQTERLQEAGSTIGKARAAQSAGPSLPTDCRSTSRAGVQPGDPLDEAVAKYDRALARQNARTLDCAAWFDKAMAQYAQGAV